MSTKKFERELGVSLSGRVVQVFAASGPTDTTEGRGPLIDHSYHASERDATIGTKGIGAMGTDGQVVPRLAVQLAGDEFILLPETSFTIDTNPKVAARLREEALSKLSPAERAALGL